MRCRFCDKAKLGVTLETNLRIFSKGFARQDFSVPVVGPPGVDSGRNQMAIDFPWLAMEGNSPRSLAPTLLLDPGIAPVMQGHSLTAVLTVIAL